MCGRMRESFLFSSIQGCYLLEIRPIFFFFLIDFSRVRGKTLQMRKKKRKIGKPAGEFWRNQPCFGLGLQADKGSGVHNLLGCRRCFPPLLAAGLPSPTVAPGEELSPGLLTPLQVRRARTLLRSTAGLAASLWPCPLPREGGSLPPLPLLSGLPPPPQAPGAISLSLHVRGRFAGLHAPFPGGLQPPDAHLSPFRPLIPVLHPHPGISSSPGFGERLHSRLHVRAQGR